MRNAQEMKKNKKELIDRTSESMKNRVFAELEFELDRRTLEFYDKGYLLLDDSKYEKIVEEEFLKENLYWDKHPKLCNVIFEKVENEILKEIGELGWQVESTTGSKKRRLVPLKSCLLNWIRQNEQG